MNDVNHCISKALVCDNPKGTLFVLEDLTGIRGATERVRTKDRYTQVSWAYYDLEQKIMYKAVRCGSALLKVDPFSRLIRLIRARHAPAADTLTGQAENMKYIHSNAPHADTLPMMTVSVR